MKKVLLSLCAALFMTGLMAQNDGKSRPERLSVEDRVERMAKSLELTDQQKKDLTAFYTEMDAKMQKEREAGEQKTEDVRAKMGDRMKEMNDKLKSILGDEKFEKWQSLRPKRGEAPNAKAKPGEPKKDQQTPPPPPAIKDGQQKPDRPQNFEMPSPEEQASRMAKHLDLTADQQTALVKHFTDLKAKHENAKKDAQKSQEERRAEMKKEREAEAAALEKIIGKDKMETLKKEFEKRREENAEKRGAK
ncbi:MAG: hypothetical protein LBR48_06095 [Dysgonamonadaceae bacterium]|jgi:hypothetical protein|nr:hypothetical protein [Dysgonamonadaceae bacterium]